MTQALSQVELLLLRSKAVILPNDDETPRRAISIGNQLKPVSNYPSAKCGNTFTWEDQDEGDLFVRSEVDSGVLRYQSQPHELKFVFDGVRYSYFPDLRRDLVGGKVEIIEVKGDGKKEIEARGPEYQNKLRLAAHIYDGIPGWSFEIFDRKRVRFPEAVWENSLRIHHRGRLAIPDAAKMTVNERLIAGGGHCRFGILADLLGGWVRGRALLFAMHVHRLVEIDLTLPLCPGTKVGLIRGRGIR